MAYHFDSYDNSIVVDGWENGIGDSPHKGLSDMRNVNIVSIPGEASVNFATSKISSPVIAATIVTGLNSSVLTFAGGATGLENGMAISFSSVGGLTGVAINTTYWVFNCAGSPTTSCKLYSDFLQTSAVVIGGTATSSPTFSSYNIGKIGGTTGAPKQFTYTSSTFGYTFMIDNLGQVWTNEKITASGYWCFTGVSGTADTLSGNGIGYYESSSGQGYIFAFQGRSIDYFSVNNGVWVYGWKPSTGTNHQTSYLNRQSSHEALLAPDNRLYYCDGSYVGVFYETTPGTPFDPTNTATYTFAQYKLLSSTEVAQCLTFLGTNIMIGGMNNVIYPWDRSSTNFTYPILLPEYNIKKMVTVNTTTFIFVGNRGRIYYTNGTNAQLYKKVPDHISGTVEPYFAWGGATSVKNQLYFSALVTTNDATAVSQYGGVWAIDLDTKAIRLTNKLSYATYAGYASALIPNFATNPAGTGLFIGWDDGNFNYGIDTTSSSPYVGGEATIDSDLIPIGTFNKTRDLTQIEYRLSKPLLSGESIAIKTRLIFNTTDAGYSTGWTDTFTSPGQFSNTHPIDFAQAQWVQFQIVLTSRASVPSYVRLKEIRILGLVGPTPMNAQSLSL